MKGIEELKVQKLSVQELLTDAFYSIPAYQRDYVWEEENIVNYIDDILYNFETNSIIKNPAKNIKAWSPYYLGNIVLAFDEEDDSQRIQIIDGQQRVSTTILFSKVLLDLCKSGQFTSSMPLKGFLKTLEDFLGGFDTKSGEVKHRLLFLYKENQEFFDKIVEKSFNELESLKQDVLTTSQKNLLNAYLTMYCKIQEKIDSQSIDQSEFENMLRYFSNDVVFSAVYAGNISTALYILQNLNNRGVGLTPSDLLKNLLLMNTTSQGQVDKITVLWKDLTKRVEEGNRRNKNITIDRFIRHYLMAKFGRPGLKIHEVFSFIQTNTKLLGISDNPVSFLQDLEMKAAKYVSYFSGTGRSKEELEPLQNMRDLRFLNQMLLLLFDDGVPDEKFHDFCEKIENLLFVYSITGKLTKDFEALFCNWALKIQTINSVDSYDTFINDDYSPELKSQYNRFVENFRTLSQAGQTQYRQKYILAKLGQPLEQTLAGKNKTTSRKAIESQYKEIEHILPQTPKEELRKEFEKDLEENESYELFVYRFGNLTLLNKPHNIVASNNYFTEKLKVYLNSTQDFKLTRAIGEDLQVGKNTALDVLVKECGLKKFDQWNKKSIQGRQEQLTQLAIRIWGLK
jgi:uncharacterized protein with ParB-like and HNH nuclease domain